VFSLCLLSQVYELASNLVVEMYAIIVYLLRHVALLVCSLAIFSAEFEITVNTLMEIDKLVQLLESPVFMSLRLQLLEPQRYSRTW